MSDSDFQPDLPAEDPTPVRRVGRKDRKPALPSPGSLFPAAADAAEPAPALPDPGPGASPPDTRFPPVDPARLDPANEKPTRRSTSRGRTDPDRGVPRNMRSRSGQPMARRRAPGPLDRSGRQDRIALLFLLATVLISVYFIYIWLNPYSPLNPLAAPRPVIVVTATPVPAGTPGSAGYRFRLAEPVVYQAAADCETLVIGGAVLADGAVVPSPYAVRVSSIEMDQGVLTGATGTFGTNGFEFARLPRDVDTYTVELYDTAGGLLAAPVAVEVRPGCAENLAVVRFTVRENE